VEKWLLNVSLYEDVSHEFGDKCGYNTFSCVNVNHYNEECGPNKYQNRLAELLDSDDLPPALQAQSITLHSPESFNQSCLSFNNVGSEVADDSRGPYMTQATYGKHIFPSRMGNISIRNDPDEIKLAEVNVLNKLNSFESRNMDLIRKRALSSLSVTGFYHVDTHTTSEEEDYWTGVIREQLRSFRADGSTRSNLLEITDKLYIQVEMSSEMTKANKFDIARNVVFDELTRANITGSTRGQRLMSKVEFRWNYTLDKRTFDNLNEDAKLTFRSFPNLSEGEYATLDSIYEHCRSAVHRNNARTSLVYFFHTHGRETVRMNKYMYSPIASWREEMSTFILKFPSICIRALLNGSRTCGVNYADAQYRYKNRCICGCTTIQLTLTSLFSGNFWWADCGHILKLPKLSFQDRFSSSSFGNFLFRVSDDDDTRSKFGEKCGYEAFNCNDINLFEEECDFTRYRDRLQELIMNVELRPTFNHIANRNPEAYKHITC
jgi:hypothetical protein